LRNARKFISVLFRDTRLLHYIAFHSSVFSPTLCPSLKCFYGIPRKLIQWVGMISYLTVCLLLISHYSVCLGRSTIYLIIYRLYCNLPFNHSRQNSLWLVLTPFKNDFICLFTGP
jgi:hypothetical protein